MEKNGIDNERNISERLYGMVAPVALLLGAISGGYTVSTAPDRISAAEVALSLQLRDERIIALGHSYEIALRELESLRATVDRIDRSGTSVGNSGLAKEIDRLDQRLDMLERRK